MATYKKLNVAATVEYKDGRHVAHQAGDVVRLDTLSDNMRNRFDEGDEWLDNIFGDSTEEDYEVYRTGRPATDPAVLAMEGVEQMTKERAEMPEAERFGSDTTLANPGDPARTLPTSGADLPADQRFAELPDADTSESLPEVAQEIQAAKTGKVNEPSAAPRAPEDAAVPPHDAESPQQEQQKRTEAQRKEAEGRKETADRKQAEAEKAGAGGTAQQKAAGQTGKGQSGSTEQTPK